MYLVTDNSQLNFLSGYILKNEYNFTELESRRCLPHCLSLVMSALFAPFEAAYALASHLRGIRAFIKAGGGSSRKRHVLEFGLTLANIDFSNTRWEGFIAAVLYLMAEQSPFELKRATEVLELSAAEGDESAVEALKIEAAKAAAGVVEPPVSHWNALYTALSDITVSTADGELCVPQDELLNYNASIINWGAAHMLATIGESAPGAFRNIQGRSAWAPEMRGKKSEMLVTAVSAVNEVLGGIGRLHNKEARALLIAETEVAARKHQEALLNASVLDNEVHPDDEADHCSRNESTLKVAVKSWKRTLHEASRAVRACAGMPKLLEALDVLKVQQCFNINVVPVALPASDAELIKMLGVPKSLQGFAPLGRIRAQWVGHTASLAERPPAPAPPPAGRKVARASEPVAAAGGVPPILSQSDVWSYWAAFAVFAPDLGMLALLHWLSPISSASVERIFSYLTALDTPARRSMKHETLAMLLFLRANWRIVELLRLELAELLSGAQGPLDRTGDAARALQEAAAAALAATRANAAMQEDSE